MSASAALASSQSGGRPSAAMTASVRSGSVQAATFVSAGASIAMAKNGAAAERLSCARRDGGITCEGGGRASSHETLQSRRHETAPVPCSGTRRTQDDRRVRAEKFGVVVQDLKRRGIARASQADRQTVDVASGFADRGLFDQRSPVCRAPSALPLSGGRGLQLRGAAREPGVRRIDRGSRHGLGSALVDVERPRRVVAGRRRGVPLELVRSPTTWSCRPAFGRPDARRQLPDFDAGGGNCTSVKRLSQPAYEISREHGVRGDRWWTARASANAAENMMNTTLGRRQAAAAALEPTPAHTALERIVAAGVEHKHVVRAPRPTVDDPVGWNAIADQFLLRTWMSVGSSSSGADLEAVSGEEERCRPARSFSASRARHARQRLVRRDRKETERRRCRPHARR